MRGGVAATAIVGTLALSMSTPARAAVAPDEDAGRPAGTTVIFHDGVTEVDVDGDALGLEAADDIVIIANTGLIDVRGTTSATGIRAVSDEREQGEGYPAVVIENPGTIAARAEGPGAAAIGVDLVDLGIDGVSVRNYGTLAAAAYGADASATAVRMASSGYNSLYNWGLVAAAGDGDRVAAASLGAGALFVYNLGTIVGALRSEGGGLVINEGLWQALDDTTFADGGTTISNGGTIALADATIDLGNNMHNVFTNYGTIAVDGTRNAIYVGAGYFRSGAGIITFVDGAADDALLVSGGLDDSGRIAFDVDTATAAGDRLTVFGDVPGWQFAVDVNLFGTPATSRFSVDLVRIIGDTTPGTFVLGDVAHPAGFVTLDVALRTLAGAPGDDLVTLDVAVDGLTPAGRLGAAFSPGVQSLVEAQVGTWRQRMGVLPPAGHDGPAAWGRLFTRSGAVDATHEGFGADDAVSFRQSAEGWELGVDFAVGANVSVGMLAGRSEGRLTLHDDAGLTRFEGDTVGLYATWQGEPGAYVDVSHRWTGVDARLIAGEDVLATDADVRTFNVEAGFGRWPLGGVGMTPQLQYTRSEVGEAAPLQVGGSAFVAEGGTSSRVRAGVLFERPFASGGYAVTPYASLGAVHEADGRHAHAINGGVLGATTIDGTSALVELGIGVRRGGFTLGGGVSWSDGGAQDDVTAAQLILRREW